MPALIFLLFIFILIGLAIFIWIYMASKKSHVSVEHLIDEERRKRLKGDKE